MADKSSSVMKGINSKLRTILGVDVTTLILVVVGFALFIAFWIYLSQWYGVRDANCTDCITCTRDLRLPDGTCIHRQERDGASCADEDVCYNSTAYPTCGNCGKCTASDPTTCNGYCPVDGDSSTCPILPFSSRLGPITPEVECLGHSCIYTVVGGFTGDCPSWLDNGDNNPLNTQGCLYTRFTDMAFEFPPGICFYRFTCAPFDFSDEVKKRVISQSSPSNFTSVANAIAYLSSNNLQFPDTPTQDYAIIAIANLFASMIDSQTTSYRGSSSSSSSSKVNNQKKNH